jgi:hypothetical protein
MTLDIRGSIKNTKLSSNRYVVFEELISNAIDSFLIRKHEDASAPSMRVEIEVDISATGLLEDREVMAVSCKDNGCGLGDDQLKAFLTKDTSYKDDLQHYNLDKALDMEQIPSRPLTGAGAPESNVTPVTPEMVQAGLEELRDCIGDPDLAYLVTSVYLAMECQRLDSLGEFRGLFDRVGKVGAG